MSRTKGVVVDGQLVWVWSDAHDILLALMVEAAEALDEVPDSWLEQWRLCACLPDLPFTTAEVPTQHDRAVHLAVWRATRDLLRTRGAVTRTDVQRWRLGDELLVCCGDLHVEPVTVAQLRAVLDVYTGVVGGDGAAPPTVVGGPGPGPGSGA